ncbi:hypothetical protein C8Q80DRAFT_349278 [Daedaleopsis nitida]|nr:hypothetical protein C8Q80DRAFT_349278 [Daedaleopsis nitida]
MSSTTTMVEHSPQVMMGMSVPPFTAHAISVSLPTWRDNVGYEEGSKRVLDAMVTGYPRFFIHRSIQKVSQRFDLISRTRSLERGVVAGICYAVRSYARHQSRAMCVALSRGLVIHHWLTTAE